MRRARPYLALLICPVVLACSFVLAALVLIGSGTSLASVEHRLVRAPTVPVLLGFSAAFLVGRWFAALDGRTLSALGWKRPTWSDALLASALIGLLVPLHLWLVFPALAGLDRSFEPNLPSVGLLSAAASFVVAVAAEETIYRGYALTLLRERLSTGAAIVLSAVGYALLAPGSGLALKAWALSLGLLLGATRLLRGTLWPGALLHLSLSLAPKLLSVMMRGE